MKVIRWPELDILESDCKLHDDFWFKTDRGMILAALLFPVTEADKLADLKQRIAIKKKELSDIEAEIYKIQRLYGIH